MSSYKIPDDSWLDSFGLYLAKFLKMSHFCQKKKAFPWTEQCGRNFSELGPRQVPCSSIQVNGQSCPQNQSADVKCF